MDDARAFRVRRAVTTWLHRAIDFPDDHVWVCIFGIVLCGFAGFAYGLAIQ